MQSGVEISARLLVTEMGFSPHVAVDTADRQQLMVWQPLVDLQRPEVQEPQWIGWDRRGVGTSASPATETA